MESILNIFKDKNGKVIIAQKPNLPIIVWFFSFILSKLPIHPTLIHLTEAISFGAIFTWAWMEIFSGVNTFRRILGVIVIGTVLTLTIINK